MLALVDPDHLASCGGARKAFSALISESRLFSSWNLESSIRGCEATATIAMPVQKEGGPMVFRAGDAAYTLDPISSSGVECALRGGIQAAAAAHTVLLGGDGDLAHRFLWDRMVEVVAGHARWARDHYASAAMDGPFWKRRSTLSIPQPQTPFLAMLKRAME